MRLPFTHEQFLDVFGAFNSAWWPAALVLWVLSALALYALARRRAGARPLFALLALHWAWSGAVYHLASFAPINPAAKLFSALFLAQAGLFAWFALRPGSATFAWGAAPRRWLSIGFALYALAYPLLGMAIGLRWPRMPAFAVPCPTTLLTVGLLLALEPRRLRGLAVIPVLWALVGGTAAFALGIVSDLALFLGAACLVAYAAAPRLFERRAG